MLSIILVAVDFSGCSEAAFRVARALARNYQARLIVLHVPTPPPFVTPGELQKALRRPDGYRAELERRLRLVYAADSPAGVEYRVQDGDPAVEILAVAREMRSDLIVMGTHGRTGLGRALLGSVAEKVLRKAPCPVMTVKVPPASASATVAAIPEQASEPVRAAAHETPSREAMVPSPKKILVATDYSACGNAALKWSAALAREARAALMVVHVDERLPLYRSGAAYSGITEPGLSNLVKELLAVKPYGGLPCEHRLLMGDPAAEILRLAQEENVDLIVLGTHGRTGARRLLLGSVAEGVLRQAVCPVLVCKEPPQL